jgi:PAS domain-containing protein
LRFWAYLVKSQRFVWYGQDGQSTATYDANEFMKRYSKEDAIRLTTALERLATRHMDEKGHEEKEETLELRAKDIECGDQELHDFIVDLTVLRHTRKGKPLVIVAGKKDITKEHHLKKVNAERSLRYLSVFYNDESGIIYFNSDGILMNANPKASELFECDIDEMVKKHVHVNKLLFTAFTNLEKADGHRGFLTVGSHAIDFHMKTVHNDNKELIGLFVFCV